MKAIPPTPEMLAVARRLVWFEAPQAALSDSVRFMAYAMARATHEDMTEMRCHVSDADFVEALDHAPPGIIDPRSWSYWSLVIADRSPPPPMPIRRFE